MNYSKCVRKRIILASINGPSATNFGILCQPYNILEAEISKGRFTLQSLHTKMEKWRKLIFTIAYLSSSPSCKWRKLNEVSTR